MDSDELRISNKTKTLDEKVSVPLRAEVTLDFTV